MAITTIVQKTEITDVDTVISTDVVEADGIFTREIRVFGPPISGAKPLIFTLRLSAPTEAAIKLSAPVQTF